jgi:hypothetical protein
MATDETATVTAAADRFWSKVRYYLWRALAADDPVALEGSLARTCQHERIRIVELIPLLRDRLWRPSNADPSVTYRRSLLAAAAGSRRGVPATGAIRCVRSLLRFPYTTAEVDEAIALCSRDAAARGEVIAVLRCARVGIVPLAAHWQHWNPTSATAHGLADALRRTDTGRDKITIVPTLRVDVSSESAVASTFHYRKV